MKNIFALFFILLFSFCFSQGKRLDNIKIQSEISDFLVDDYGQFYFYQKNNFSLSKIDSLGKQLGLWMEAFPFKIQPIQNPMNVVLFSENKQELKFLDLRLNEIQSFQLSAFGYITMAYAENLQQIWLLDQSEKRLLQYQFRDHRRLKSIPISCNLEGIKDMIVFQNTLYLLSKNELFILNLDTLQSQKIAIQNARKLKRENEDILVFTLNSILKYIENQSLKEIFVDQSLEFVDKNSQFIYGFQQGNVYLYPTEK